MDSKEIKNTLKNAREAIRNKEFKDALKHCKAVLNEDKNNYMALVLIAVAAEGLEEYEQALRAYKRAVEADDTQALAWQGLSSFYEKNPLPAYKPDHIKVYMRLMELNSGDRGKKLDILSKLSAIIDDRCEEEQIQMTLKHYRTVISEEADNSQRSELQWRLVSLLQISNVPDKIEEIVQNCKEVLTKAGSEVSYLDDIINLYLNLLIKKGEQNLMEVCAALYQKYPSSVSALRYFILCQLDTFMVNQEVTVSEEFEELITKLGSLSPESDIDAVLTTAQGCILLYKGDLHGAKRLLESEQGKKLVCGFYFLALTLLHIHENMAAMETCENGLKELQRKDRTVSQPVLEVTRSLKIVKVQALNQLGARQSLASALEIVDKEFEPEMPPDILLLRGCILVRLGDIDGAKKCVVSDSAKKLSLEGKICLAQKDYETARIKFQEAAERDDGNFENHLDLAKCLWESGDQQKECFHALLKAAKLDPYCSTTFMYLGHYYSSVANDLTRARNCYQKSFDLDDLNDEAGAALCDLMTSIGEEKEAHSMLVEATNKASAGTAKWAWLRLGLYQMKYDDPSVAIASFQAALRADPRDNHVWECLAEAYYYRGSYTAALKAFTKASELDPDSMYCLFQMASIKQTLGVYTEAIEEYRTILEKSPNYVPALKGLGETYLLQARTLMSKFFHGRAKDNAQLAVQHLTRAVSYRPDLSCMWKLMGDACTILHILPADNFRFEVPARLVKSSELAPRETAVLNKLNTLELGGRCYGKALKIYPECSSLWHDLGVNYFHQSSAVIETDISSLAEKTIHSLKKAISLEPTNHKHWTALGYVTCQKEFRRPDLAQHCFIKSIQCEANNVVAWTNLAALYLKNGNIQLAHEAFKIAQSLEPSYIPCWIGQATIAELVGHEDAMDLFRHTTELGNHIEGALGYGHWVCSLLLDTDKHSSELYQYAIHQMAAIPAASDALARYTDRVKRNWKAYNMYGLLLEQQELYRTAAEAFEKSLVYVEVNAKENVYLNYARVLCKSGQFERAVEVYDRISSSEQFHDLCQMGLAYCKAGRLEKSFQAYTKALSLGGTETEQSHVYAALAMVQYKFGDLENTKSTLFKGFQLSEPSLWGLEALYALALLKSDVTLATAVQEELSKHVGAESHLADTMFLDMVLNVQNKGVQEALRQVLKSLYRDPGQADLWYRLSAILLRYCPFYGRAITNTAGCSLAVDDSRIKDKMKILAAGHLCGGYHSNNKRNDNSFLSAQRLVHCFPDAVEHWSILASAVHSEAILSRSAERGQTMLENELCLLQFILSQGDGVSPSLKLWCCKQSVVSAVLAGKENDAFSGLEKLLTDFSDTKEVPVFIEVFNNVLLTDSHGLRRAVQEQPVLYYWQILLDMYLTTGVIQDIEEIVQHYLQSAYSHRGQEVQVTCLLKLAHFVFQQIMKQNAAVELWNIFEDAASQVQSLKPEFRIVHLMKACLHFQENKRLSKHHLQRVLHSQMRGSKGHDHSLAHQMLLYILHTGMKDQDLIQVILGDAEESGDQDSLDYYHSLTAEH